MLVAVLGGLLGILMMIPLRRALIVEQHGTAQVSRRHGVRRGAEGGRVGRSRRAAASEAPSARWRSARRRRRRAPRRSSPASASASSTRRDERRVPLVEGHAGESLRRAVRGRLDLGRDLARAARRRLHHRPAHRLDHVRGRRARLPRAHPAIKFFGAGPRDAARPETTRAHQGHAPDAIRGAYMLYIGAGAVAAGGIISVLPLAADDLARPEGRTRRIMRGGSGGARGDVSRTDQRPVDEARAHRQLRARRSRSPSPIRCTSAARA